MMKLTIRLMHLLIIFMLFTYTFIPWTSAGIPEPPMLIYGSLTNLAGAEVNSGTLRFEFTSSSGGTPVSFQVIPASIKPGINFLIRITMESGGIDAGANVLENGNQYTPVISYNGKVLTTNQLNGPLLGERAKIIGPLALVVDAVGVTPTPGGPTPVVTPTPIVTPTPGSNTPVAQPDFIYEFDKNSLSSNGWAEIPGGFDSHPAGSITFIDYSSDSAMIPSTSDHKGMVLNVLPGMVAFTYAMNPVVTNGKSVLMRMTTRANSANASLWLVGLKGSMQTGAGIDGSLALNSPISAAGMQAGEQQIVLYYKPENQAEVVTPIIQVAGSSAGSGTSILIDRLEIYLVDDNKEYPCILLSLNNKNVTTSITEALPLPVKVHEFDLVSLNNNSWSVIPGGFIQAEAAGIIPLDFSFDPNILPSSKDREGLAVVASPGQVSFVYSTTPVKINGGPVLMRMTMQADSPGASVWLVGLKGDIATAKDMDGSLSFANSANTTNFAGREDQFIVLYEPDGSELFTPAFQVAGNTGTQTIVLIDRIEIFQLESNKSYLGSFLSR